MDQAALGYENPPGVRADQRIQHFLESDRAGWYNHVNLNAHDHGGHFIPAWSRKMPAERWCLQYWQPSRGRRGRVGQSRSRPLPLNLKW
jgi:microsomal epoxide hydrolase